MKYINLFKNHSSYEEKLNGGVDISLPNVSYCEDARDVHYTPYNLVRFYVGEITEAQTVSIYTDKTNHVDVQVSEGNKWYSYVLPKDKGLCKIEGDSVKKVVVKADISFEPSVDFRPYDGIIPTSTVEASFKGSKSSKVTNMINMFCFCSGLTSLDVSSFDTSNATSMKFMFKDCSCLTSLDVSNFNTSNVTDMSDMFQACDGLTSLDVSSFDTSNVTSMASMFHICSGLTSLDLSNFNTSNVTDMRYMFADCYRLTSLDLSNFNTSNVTNMYEMFRGCNGLTSLDLSKWDTSKVTDMSYMFKGCKSLNTIRMKGCSEATVNKIKAQLTTDGITGATIATE